MNRYAITVDKQSFIRWHREVSSAVDTSFETHIPESGGVWNDVEEDLVIVQIIKNGEDATVECITEYSNWYGTQGTRG